MKDETRLIHPPAPSRPTARTVGPAVQKGSTVLMADAASLYDAGQQTYGLEGLASQDALRAALCDLEGASYVALYPSGLAAVTGALLAVLKAGDEILVVDSAYQPTRRFCDRVLARFGVTTRYYPPRASADELAEWLSPVTRLILIESPGSLTMEVQDVPAIAAMARARGVLTLMDNTWAAGLLFRPLDHGVDISVQALTKYVGGHSDLFMGAAACRDVELAATLDDGQHQVGWGVNGDDAYQMYRGLKTLAVRLKQHEANGLAVADWLSRQAGVSQVLYPPLPGAPDHALWARDFTGGNGLVSVVLKPVKAAAVDALLDRLELFGLGFSWGGFESLAIHAGTQLRERMPTERPDGPLLRLNVGLESADDQIADLGEGFAALAEKA